MRISSGAAVLCACLCACSIQACGNDDDGASGIAGSVNGAGSPGAGTGGSANTQPGNTSMSGAAMNGGSSTNPNGGSTANGGAAVGNGGTAGAPSGGSSIGTAGNANAGTTGSGGASPAAMTPFPSTAPFYQDISKAPLDSQSGPIMKALDAIGWGDSDKRTTLGIDFSFNINLADGSVPRRPLTKGPKFYSPDCDTAPVPLPIGGKGEGVANYACSGGDDCHLFVYQGSRYYELYQSNVTGGLATGGNFTATCLVVWDLSKDYWIAQNAPDFSRGDGCTGGDAADLPMAPLVITKAEIASGSIKHALRFTIDNNRINADVYVHPATHLGGPSGGTSMLPYGARLRLRGDYPLASLANDHARAVAKALQTYGMYLADGGNIYISATSDSVDLINNAILTAIKPIDFEMLDGGTRIDASKQDCKHVPLTQ